MKHIIAAFLLFSVTLFALPAIAQTEKEDAIDIAYHDCIAKDSSCANVDACAFTAYGKWNKEMENAYNKLLKELKKTNEKAMLKQSQTAWKAYRDAEFKTFDNMFNYPGNGYCLLRHNGKIDIAKARALQLRGYTQGLKQQPVKDAASRKKKH